MRDRCSGRCMPGASVRPGITSWRRLLHLLPLIDPEALEKAELNRRSQRVEGQVSPWLGDMLDVIRHADGTALHVTSGALHDVLVDGRNCLERHPPMSA